MAPKRGTGTLEGTKVATTLTRNLRLRVDSNLTANSKYNLERIDLLGATFLTDSTNQLNIRSQTDIAIEPNSADLGGSGIGGTVSIGNSSHSLDEVSLYASEILLSAPVGLLDQASGGNKYLQLRYKSDISGSVDTSSDRFLSVDVNGANRNLVLGGDLTTSGGSLTLTLSGSTNVTLPLTGTLSTLAGVETLTNKTIDALSNTITNISNSNISASAGIVYSKLNLLNSITSADISSLSPIQYSKLTLVNSILNSDINSAAAISYSKLNLTGSIVNADISAIAAISGTKISPNFGNQVVSTTSRFRLDNGSFTTDLLPASSGQSTNLQFRLPPTDGSSGQVLRTDGSGELDWATVSGTGTVTSVDLTMPTAIFDVAGGPITTSGTLTVTLDNQSANIVFAGPSTGPAATPTFRALVPNDLPNSIPAIKIAGGSVDDTEFSHLNGVTSSIQGQLDGKQPLDSDLSAIAGLSGTGLITRTGSGTVTTRTIMAGTGILITNGDGILGHPTIESTITQYTDENAQDAVGGILTDSSSVDFTYNDSTPSISAVVLPGGVDHDQLLNFVANEHVDHSSVQIATGSNSGLAGGGNITATRNLLVDSSNAPTVSAASGDLILFADVSNSNSLSKTTVSDIASFFSLPSFKATWALGDGTTKAVTHNLGSTDVLVQVFDISDGQTIYVDTVVRTDNNTVTLTSSEAPGASGWRVLILKV